VNRFTLGEPCRADQASRRKIMQEQASGSVGNVLLAFLAGAALGGLVVALITPKSGEDLRADIKGLGNRMKEKAGEALAAAGSSIDEARHHAGKAASAAEGGIREAAQELRG
jgi:gas vesicle protein